MLLIPKDPFLDGLIEIQVGGGGARCVLPTIFIYKLNMYGQYLVFVE